jgi:Flp pilus assembly pilin Flp
MNGAGRQGIAMILRCVTWIQLKADRRAVTTVEYCLIGAALVATVVVGFQLLANSASTKFSGIGHSL